LRVGLAHEHKFLVRLWHAQGRPRVELRLADRRETAGDGEIVGVAYGGIAGGVRASCCPAVSAAARNSSSAASGSLFSCLNAWTIFRSTTSEQAMALTRSPFRDVGVLRAAGLGSALELAGLVNIARLETSP
jgi:hypothetical protein